MTLINTIFYFLICFPKINTIIDYSNLLSHCVGSKEIQGIWEKEWGASWFLSYRFSCWTPSRFMTDSPFCLHPVSFITFYFKGITFLFYPDVFSLAAFLIPVIRTNSLFCSIFLFGTKICSSEVILFLFLDIDLSLFSSNRLCPIRLAVS